MKFLFHFGFELPAGQTAEDVLLGRVASSGTVASMQLSLSLAELGHDCTILAAQPPARAGGVAIETIGQTSAEEIEDLSVQFAAAGKDAILVLPPASAMRVMRAIGTRKSGSIVFWLTNNLSIVHLDEAFAIGLDRAICLSSPAAAAYDAYPWWSRVEVIPFSLHQEMPDRVPTTRGERVAFIGALSEAKGFHHLLAAWPAVLELTPNATLDVFGSVALHHPSAKTGTTGVMTSEFEDRHWRPFVARAGERRAGQVRFRGSVNRRELFAELQHIRVAVVNPNLTGSMETFCLSALEAQACGVPVVGGAAEGLLETVADGRSGLLVRSQSPQELADAIVRLLQDDAQWRELSAGARQQALKYASPIVEAERWVAMAQRMRAGEPAPRRRSRSGQIKGITGFGRAKLALKRMMNPRPDGPATYPR